MNAFQPTGPLLGFTGANTAPTSVQAVANTGGVSQHVCLTNTDTTNDCVVGWAASDAQAKLNAAVANLSSSCYYLIARTQVIVGFRVVHILPESLLGPVLQPL